MNPDPIIYGVLGATVGLFGFAVLGAGLTVFTWLAWGGVLGALAPYMAAGSGGSR